MRNFMNILEFLLNNKNYLGYVKVQDFTLKEKISVENSMVRPDK